jgi:uncharacterized protein YcbK (DUF882 family)
MANRFDGAMSRRALIGSVILGSVLLPFGARSAVAAPRTDLRELAFENLHTGERVTLPYFIDGRYQAEALRKIDWILRDHRSGEVAEIDRRLLDLLHDLVTALNAAGPIQIISGFRSAQTNALLASASSGVARKSLHMRGKAVDIRIPGVRLTVLREAAMSLRGGGVGFYPQSRFVHVDVGRVRYW